MIYFFISALYIIDSYNISFKERGGGQTFSVSFWMRFRQVPLCSYKFKIIFDDIIIFNLGQYDYICF